MVWTLKGRGLALLAAAPLLAAVPAVAHADGPGPNGHKGDKGSASKPAPKHKHKTPKHGAPEHKAPKHKAPKHKDKAPKHEHKAPKHKHKAAKPKTAAKPKAHASVKKPQAHGVALRMKSPQQSVVPGRTYTWTFTVAARGKGEQEKAAFKTTLPRSLEYVSGEKHCKAAGQKVFCRLGTLEKGEKATGAIRAKVTGRAKPGETIRPRGTAVWGRDRVTHRFPAVRVARTADLALAQKAPATARAGAEIPYTLRIRNLGPAAADSVTLESRGPIKLVDRDTACVPRGASYLCAVGGLQAGEARTLRFTAVPRGNVRAGTVLTASWRASSPVPDTDRANNAAVVRTKITKSR